MNDSIKYLNDENFEDEIASGVTLVDFYADWCGPCKMIEPVVRELSLKVEGKAKVAKLDIESAQKSTTNYGVTSIPTMILFKDGSEVNRIVGVKDLDALLEIIDQAL